MASIKFGTDGWRGVIAEDFTFNNVKIVTQAIADYLNSQKENSKILIGYDTRFLSNEFALTSAKVLAGNKINVYITNHPTPTPVVSFSIVDNKFDGGIIITASHNPPKYNGLKFKGSYGGPAFVEITNEIEKFLYKTNVKEINDDEIEEKIKFSSYKERYINKITSYVDMKLIKNAKFKVVIDPMYGTAIGYIDKILSKTKLNLTMIHNEYNPLFGGKRPEPIKENLLSLIKEVKMRKADAGFATDGDADRIGVVDGNGNFISAQQVMSLLLIHLLKNKKMRGAIVKTNAMTMNLNKIAEKFNIPIYETPVGFKHVAKLMLEKDILIGGEESGGIGFKNFVPERDGILSVLLLIEMMTMMNKNIKELVKDMEKEFGKFVYKRVDMEISDDKKEKILSFLMNYTHSKILTKKVSKKTTFDGIKFYLHDNSWILFRASGTEPLIRIYVETSSKNDTNKMIEFGTNLINKL